jgi:glycosyltransferase involved in cell wall biosynthesis
LGLSVVESCTAVKATSAKYLLRKHQGQIVTYLDPDIQVYESLGCIESEFGDKEFLLTPHLIDPPYFENSVRINEISGALIHGVYNLGFFSVRYSSKAFEVLDWWEQRLFLYCKAKSSEGMFTDQKWFDIGVNYFNQIGVSKNRGFNVAPWNIGERLLSRDSQGIWVSGDEPLRFFHFSSYDSPAHLSMIKQFDLSNIAIDLNQKYREKLEVFSPMMNRINSLYSSSTPVIQVKTPKPSLKKKVLTFAKGHTLIRKTGYFLPARIRNIILDLLSNHPESFIEISRTDSEPNKDYFAKTSWFIVTHAGVGGADRVAKSLAGFANIQSANFAGVIKPEPTSVRLEDASGKIQIRVDGPEFLGFIQKKVNSDAKFIVNHSLGNEWWLEQIDWSLAKPIIFVHDRTFIQETLFNPIKGKDLSREVVEGDAIATKKTFLRWENLINSAEAVLAPSHWIYQEMKAMYPHANINLFPWIDSQDQCAIPKPHVNKTEITLAVLGATGKHKGLDDLISLKRESVRLGVSIRCLLVADLLPNDLKKAEEAGIICIRYIQRSRLIRLLRDYGVDFVWLCSNVQETFSFATSDVIYSGIPVIAKDGGAYSERLALRPSSILYNPSMPLEQLISLMQNAGEYSAESRKQEVISTPPIFFNPFVSIDDKKLREFVWMSIVTGI